MKTKLEMWLAASWHRSLSFDKNLAAMFFDREPPFEQT